MQILVTGGAGFIGSHVVDAYVAAGHKVTIIDNLSTGFVENLNPQAKFVEGDIRDKELIGKLFAEGGFEVVNHLAAQAGVQVSLKDPVVDAEINILGTVNLLEAAKNSEVKNFIYFNTGGALYGEAKVMPTPEDYPCQPLTPYGLSKLTAESYVRLYQQIFGLPYTVLRCSNVYGPRQHPKGEAGVISIFAKKLLKGEAPEIFNDGNNTRDYVYVKDVVAASVTALEKPLNQAVNLGTATETSVNLLYTMISKELGVKIEPLRGRKTIEQLRSCLDFSKAKKLLGWSPKYSLAEGLKETLAWYKKQR